MSNIILIGLLFIMFLCLVAIIMSMCKVASMADEKMEDMFQTWLKVGTIERDE